MVFWTVLKSVSRSFYLSLRYLPEPIRTPLALAYLMARLADTLADSSEIPVLTRQELLHQFKACILAEDGQATAFHQLLSQQKHPILQNTWTPFFWEMWHCFLQQPLAVRQEIQWVLTHITEGQLTDLEYFDTESPGALTRFLTDEALDAYLYSVAGCVGEFWTRLCFLQLPHFSQVPLSQMITWGVHFGKALQLTNILRDLPADLLMGRMYLPVPWLPADKASNEMFSHFAEQNFSELTRWHQVAMNYLAEAKLYIQAVQLYRVRLACVLPYWIAQNLLKELADFDYIARQRCIKISRKQVYGYVTTGLLSQWIGTKGW